MHFVVSDHQILTVIIVIVIMIGNCEIEWESAAEIDWLLQKR